MSGLIGKKIGMTSIFNADGDLIPVTVIKVDNCRVVNIKTFEKDGYETVQLGFGIRNEKKLNKSLLGYYKKNKIEPPALLKEFKGFDSSNMKVGDEIKVDLFKEDEIIKVKGKSIGKGFQGVMKRLNYSGGAGSHGSMFNRAPGSIGASAYPSRVWKNKGMPGQMGNVKVTVKNLEIVKIKQEENLLIVKGAVPGANGGYLVIRGKE